MKSNASVFNIVREDSYVVLPTFDEELIFSIALKEGDVEEPFIMYDNSEHALLFRSETDVVILDFLKEEVQYKLSDVDKAYILEIDYSVKKLKENYEAPVQIVEKYPFDISKYL